MFKIFKNIIMHKGIKLIHTYAHKNAQLFLNYNIEILQHDMLYI